MCRRNRHQYATPSTASKFMLMLNLQVSGGDGHNDEGASFEQHCRDLVEGADARVHLHGLVEAVGVGGLIAAPAAFTHHHAGEVEVESLAHARLDAAIGGAAAD